MLSAGRLNVGHMVTHHVALDEFERAYETFAGAGETGALKVVVSRN
jgi:alcohol dehydrogenase